MHRPLLFLLSFCLFLVPDILWAQDVSVRGGDHEGYSRIVFDLDGAAEHSAAREGDSVVITLQRSGTVDTYSVDVRNILGVIQDGSDPIKLKIKTYDGAKFRDFKIGTRLIVDVYDVSGQPKDKPSQGGKSQESPAGDLKKQSVNDSDSAAREKKTDHGNPDHDGPDQAVKKTGDALNEMAASGDARVEADAGERGNPDNSAEPEPEPEPEVEAEAIDSAAEEDDVEPEKVTESSSAQDALHSSIDAEINAMLSDYEEDEDGKDEEVGPKLNLAELALDPKVSVKPQSNLFSFSSTRTFGMAIYREAGRIWMITDKPDAIIEANIAGPQVDFFKPLEETPIRGGRVYSTRYMDGTNIKGQGGGVLWKFISAPDEFKLSPVKPEYMLNDKRSGGGYALVFPFKTASSVLDMKDNLTGADLKVVTVNSADEYVGEPKEYVEFEMLRSPIGMVIRPKIDNLIVRITNRGVEVFKQGGLTLMTNREAVAARATSLVDRNRQRKSASQFSSEVDGRIYHFDLWYMGGVNELNENKNIILAALNELTQGGQIEDLINLAKMHLSNGRGAEALGFLRYAEEELPSLKNNPEFIALRGAASAFDFKIEAAYHDLMRPELDIYNEINLWRSFIFAQLGDWNRAATYLDTDYLALYSYTPMVRNRIGTTLAEVALRAGDVKKATNLFKALELDRDTLNRSLNYAIDYLKGEAARQKGDVKMAEQLWTKLAESSEDLYRVKGGLALTWLLLKEGKITNGEAIDRLERLRYSWRGDELEVQVNYQLGKVYFDAGQYIKALKIMRQAIGYAKGMPMARDIAKAMTEAFTTLYIGDKLSEVSPLDAVAIYEQFSELTPPGAVGDQVVAALAEHLVRADLLDRAGDLLQHQITHRLKGRDAADAATRLAAIRLIDKKPGMALQAVKQSNDILKSLGSDITNARYIENTLLRARAISMQGSPKQALDMLDTLRESKDVNRLRAAIAWDANYWDDAADALRDVILDENISRMRTLSPEHAALILNRAVALNLAGDRIALANIRERYTNQMNATVKGKMFEVVTRPRQNATLADRETLMSITSEVDLFSDFLSSYKDFKRR